MTNPTISKAFRPRIINALAAERDEAINLVEVENRSELAAGEQTIACQRETKSVRANPAGLRIVDRCAQSPDSFSLLLMAESGPKRVKVAEQGTDVPLIDLALYEHFQGTGRLIQTVHGEQIEVWFIVQRNGVRRSVLGAAVCLLNGPEVRLPRGTLAKLDTGKVIGSLE